MSKVDEIKDAIEALPNEDYTQLRQWFSKKIGKNGTNRLKQTRKQENWIS